MTEPSRNPYQPPSVDAPTPATADASSWYPEASRGARFANLLIDNVMFLVFAFLIGVVLAFVAPAVLEEELHPLLDRVFGVILMTAYYIGFEAVFGVTPGKLVTGTKVLTTEGRQPSISQIVGRSLARLVPFDPLSFFSSEGGWHDRWSGTQVVKVRGESGTRPGW